MILLVVAGLAGYSAYTANELVHLREKATALDREINGNKTDLSNYETLISSQTAQLDEASADNAQLQDELELIKASNAELNQALNAKRGELSKTVSRLDSLNKKLEADIAALTKDAEEDQARIAREAADANKTHEELIKNLRQEIRQGQISISKIKGRLTVNVAETLFFASGRAEVKPRGEAVLLRVASVLKRIVNRNARIEGHTDNLPIGDALIEMYPTNWELSTDRAVNVVRILEEEGGVDPKMLEAAGYGSNRPIASNRTAKGRSKNRRIEIVLIPKETAIKKKSRRSRRRRSRRRYRKKSKSRSVPSRTGILK
ncbi:MAG: flagellar motor protein MotB [Elusimicrobiota bacterium]